MGGLGDMLLHDLYSPDGDPHCSAPPSPVMLDGTQPLGDPPGSVPSSPAHGSAPASPDDGPAQSECGSSGSRTSRRTGSRSRSRSQERFRGADGDIEDVASRVTDYHGLPTGSVREGSN